MKIKQRKNSKERQERNKHRTDELRLFKLLDGNSMLSTIWMKQSHAYTKTHEHTNIRHCMTEMMWLHKSQAWRDFSIQYLYFVHFLRFEKCLKIKPRHFMTMTTFKISKKRKRKRNEITNEKKEKKSQKWKQNNIRT